MIENYFKNQKTHEKNSSLVSSPVQSPAFFKCGKEN